MLKNAVEAQIKPNSIKMLTNILNWDKGRLHKASEYSKQTDAWGRWGRGINMEYKK